ncbi:MAG TPA: acetamidase/formamidase family protein [Gemmatimonadaceae bacterium]|nr:acetamidase/formamidase family protein [Gemmatimonadaceae bacterium]
MARPSPPVAAGGVPVRIGRRGYAPDRIRTEHRGEQDGNPLHRHFLAPSEALVSRIRSTLRVGIAIIAALGDVTPGRLQAQSRAADAAGEWTFRMTGDATPQRVRLTADADSIRGSVYGQKFAGTLSGRRLTFAVGEFRWRATLTGDSLAGWLGVGTDSSRWSGYRLRAPAAPRAFTFVPTQWHRELGITTTPVLRIHAGDTVRTTTVDAGGWGIGELGDRTNKRTRGGNPLTGPFYVEGALPGDVLAVKLLRVRLNRGWATSGTSLMDNAIQPSYATERKPGNDDNKWMLDTLRGVARLAKPSPQLRDLTIPLTPFLGVVAVAPGDGVVPSSRDSGPWGGNMEYAQLREGTTLYLPVTEEGAWLYLGDGHAAQGDGELTGDALETSMDVAFTVDVRRSRFESVPRAESATDIMSIGIAGSLDEALRRATSDMARWLEKEYRLTSTEAAMVMGFALAYEIPDIVPPWVSVAARVRKSALQQLHLPAARP